MELKTQKYLRLILPGVLLYGLLVMLCWTTMWCELAVPQSVEEVTKLLAAIVLGTIYAFTNLREWSNRYYHCEINRNIISNLIAPFQDDNTSLKDIGWQKMRHIFYYFVDKDDTLKVKMSIIRFNGLLWTTVADLRAVCIIGILIFLGSIICSYLVNVTPIKFEEYRAGIPMLFLTILFFLTFHFSKVTTERHKTLGGEQCEYILAHYRDELEQKLYEIARHDKKENGRM